MQRRLERNRGTFENDSPDPMNGVSNLADVMLVLAVGIMLALIMNWRISINGGQITQMKDGQLKEVDQSELHTATDSDDLSGQSSNLKEKGKVYVDETSGKLYLVEPKNE